MKKENKVHQKTVLVQFGLVNFRPFKIGKNWIASGFRPRNDEKDFLPKRTIKYKNTCCKLTLGLRKKNSEFENFYYNQEKYLQLLSIVLYKILLICCIISNNGYLNNKS